MGAENVGGSRTPLSRDWAVLGLAAVVGIAFGRMQTGAKNQGKVDFASGLARSTVLPLSGTWANLADSVGGFTSGVFRAGDLARRNQQLESQVRILEQRLQQQQDFQRDANNLRKLLDLPVEETRQRIATRIVGFSPRDNRITLDKGSAVGIRPGLVVMVPDGVIGIVQSVQAGSSVVALIWSPAPFKIGALTGGNPPSAGLLSGESAERLRLELFDVKAPIKVGDTVVTSGYSQTIPGGLPIGRVVAVEDDLAFGRKMAQVFPFAQMGGSREAVVIR